MSDYAVGSRRAFLTVCGVGASALAGCSGFRSTSNDDNTGDQTPGWPSYGASARNNGHVPADLSPPENLRPGWEFETTLDGVAPPTFGSDTVYARVGNRLYAFDAADGSTRWTTEMDWDVGGPILGDGTVYAGGRYGLIAYDAADGTEQWRVEKDGPVISAPMVVDDTVYFASSLPGGIVAVGTGGEKQWWFDSKGDYVYGPTVSKGTAYYSAVTDTFGKKKQGPWFVYAINTDNGTKRWRFRQPQGTTSLPAVANGTVYVGSTDGHLYALDAASGNQQWTASVPLATDSPPVVVDGTVYVGSTDGHVYAFDVRDGSREWRVTLDAPLSQGIAVTESAEIIYAGTDAGTLFALKPRSVIDRVTLSAPVATPPAVRGESVIIGTQDGRVYALTSKDNHTPQKR
jgi:outer membrane protein assembly factor BamB